MLKGVYNRPVMCRVLLCACLLPRTVFGGTARDGMTLDALFPIHILVVRLVQSIQKAHAERFAVPLSAPSPPLGSAAPALAFVSACAYRTFFFFCPPHTLNTLSVFDSDAAADFDAKMNHGTPMKHKYFRCRNNNDIVPRVPLTMTHVGTEIYLDRL